MGMIMDEKSFNLQDEEGINCKNGQRCKIVAKTIRASCKCIGCIFEDLFQ